MSADTSPLITGVEIRSRREALGLSQAQLAELLDVAQMTISRWERGTREPSESAAQHASTQLGYWSGLADAIEAATLDRLRAAEAKSTGEDVLEVPTFLDDDTFHAADPTGRQIAAPASLHRIATVRAVDAFLDEAPRLRPRIVVAEGQEEAGQ